MKILKKIIEAIVPVSRKKFNLCMTEVTTSLNGIIVAIDQQSEMSANIIQQVSGMQMKKAEIVEGKKEVDDPAFG